MFENERNSFGRAIEELHLKSFTKLRTIQHLFVVFCLCLVRSLFNNLFFYQYVALTGLQNRIRMQNFLA